MIGNHASDMRKVTPRKPLITTPTALKINYRFLDFSDSKAIMVNNADWLLDLNFVEFMRE